MAYMTIILDGGQAGQKFAVKIAEYIGEPTEKIDEDCTITCVWKSPQIDDVHQMIDEVEGDPALLSVSYDSGEYETTTNA